MPPASEAVRLAEPGGVTDAVLAEALVFESGRVLLIRRRDVPVWTLPGGHRDPGESAAAACVREVHEETGVQVALEEVVLEYVRPWWLGGGRAVVFRAVPAGGALRPGDWEAEASFWPVEALPTPLLYWYAAIIEGAMAQTAASPAPPTLGGFLASTLRTPGVWWPLARHAVSLFIGTRLAQWRVRKGRS